MTFGKNFAMNRLYETYSEGTDVATVEGIGFKTLGLLAVTLVTALLMIGTALRAGGIPIGLYLIAAVSIIVFQIIMMFNMKAAKVLAIPYAISEGLTIGCLCGLLELVLPGEGLAFSATALTLTLSIFVACILLYSLKIVKVGYKFRNFVLVASIGFSLFVLIFFLMSLIMSFTSSAVIFSFFYMDGIVLAICAIMCVFATLYVLMSIANASDMVNAGVAKEYEWFAAYAIVLNVIYLFVEILRLLLILASRNRD